MIALWELVEPSSFGWEEIHGVLGLLIVHPPFKAIYSPGFIPLIALFLHSTGGIPHSSLLKSVRPALKTVGSDDEHQKKKFMKVSTSSMAAIGSG